MDRVQFGSGVMMVSRKHTEPSGCVFSTVNLMALSLELMYFMKFSLCSICCLTKVSSTYFFYNLGGVSAVLRALDSKASMYKLGVWTD